MTPSVKGKKLNGSQYKKQKEEHEKKAKATSVSLTRWLEDREEQPQQRMTGYDESEYHAS